MPQLNYDKSTLNAGLAGLKVGVGHYESTCTPTGGAVQVDTVTIDSAANDIDYTATITTVDNLTSTATFNSGGTGLTTTQIAAGLLAQMQLDGLMGANFEADSAVAIITTTGINNRTSYTITSGTNSTAANSNAASTGTSIPFGAGVMRNGTTRNGYPACLLPSATSVPAQVDTLTPTAIDLTAYFVSIQFLDEKGLTYGPFTMTSDASATATEIVTGLKTAIDAGMPTNTVAESGTATLILTSEIPGIGFKVSVETTANWASLVTTTANGGKQFAGVAAWNTFGQVEAGEVATNPANRAMSVVETEEIFALLDAGVSPASTDPVYLRRVATGTEQAGAFRNAADSTDCFYVRGARWSGTAFTGQTQSNIARVVLERVAAL